MRITISLAAALLAALSAPAQMVSPNLERGFDPQKAYALEEIGVVNVFNGNLNVTLPIGANYPVSSTLSYGVGLQYGGNNWEYDTIEEPLLDEDGEPICQIGDNGECRLVMQTYGWSYPSPYDNAGFGWRLHFGRLLPEGTKGGNMSAYESPDGAVHTFYPRLHDTDAGVPAGTFYTRDGSYLRMKLDGDHVTVESPNGTIREFDVTTGHVSNGGAVAIRDAFGNSVEIDYDYTGPAPLPRFAGTYRVWRIHDSVGRNHYVYLRPAATYHEEFPPAPVTHWSVGEVRLQMPGNHAVWEFHYAGETGAPPAWASLGRPCMDVPPYINVGERVQAALLEKVVPPAGNAYTFSYDVSDYDTGACHESSGALKSVTLPTLGRVEWKYTLNHYPPNPTAVTNHKNPPGLYKSLAVQHRTVRNANNVVTGYREYETVSDKSLPGQPALEQKVTVTDYTNDEKTTILRKSENFFSLCNSENCVARGEYALPFTRKDLPDREETDVQGRHLSTITYGLNGDWSRPFQRTYVAYEADIALNTAARGIVDYNRRLKSQRTVHYTSSASEWIDNLSHGFDGLGHYRVTEVKASFGATSRTTRQNFNPAAGEYAIGGGTFVLPSSWVLGLFDFVEVTDTGSGGMTTHRTDYCFGSTGFLERKRTRRFASEPKRDLLAVFSGVAGDVTREEYYGGDETELPAAVTCTSSLGQVPKYAVNHSYIYGVRSTSQHDGTSFLSMDLDVDSSGLVVASRDTAGKPTTFKYDPLGRIEEIRPDGVAWTQYQYIAAGNASNPATVIARQWPHGSAAGGTALTETRYFYDHLGRLVQQRNWMSGVAADPWSAVRTSYDALGRNVGTSVATGVSTGAFSGFTAPETVTAYDALGRVIATTQPDGSQATIVHTGASTVERTIRIATSSTEETSVSTQERMDGLGRLVSIVENEHVEHGVQKGVETTYRYDPADRLTQVLAGIQTRTFQYDGAGLLTSESHPETVGATTYLYDSRGHVTKKTAPAGTLLMTYDPAERLQSVSVENGLPLQEFTYDATSPGRMATATRHNHHAELGGDVTVTETFRYGGPGGRLSSKETAVRTVRSTGWPTGQTFTEAYTYDPTGEVKTVTYPTCSGCGSLVPPRRTVENRFERGYLKSVMGYTKDMKYHPNGLLSTLQRLDVGGGDGPLYEQRLAWHRMNRPGEIALSGDCTNLSISKQPEAKTVVPGQPANLSVEASGATKYEWFVAGSATPIAGQNLATLTASVTTPTLFFARVSNGACSVDSAPAQVSLCTPPDATITTEATINPNGHGTASVAVSGTYAWSIENGTLLSAENAREITFRANCTGPVKLRVSVTAAGCPATSSRDVTVITPSVTVSATPSSVVAGASTSLAATLSGTGPWSLTWNDDPSVTAATRAVIPPRTTTYSVTHVNGCPGSWGSVTVDVTPPPAPVALKAMRTTAGVQLTWSVPPGADVDSYTVYRCEMSCVGTTGSPLPDTITTPQHLDRLVGADRAYVYRVSARKLETVSAPSAIDFASGVVFSDYPIVAGGTPARATQLMQMRAAVDGLRLAGGLSPGIYTDTPQGGLKMRARHLLELRDALNEALRRLGSPDVVFSEQTLTPGSSAIRARYFNQIMEGVQ